MRGAGGGGRAWPAPAGFGVRWAGLGSARTAPVWKRTAAGAAWSAARGAAAAIATAGLLAGCATPPVAPGALDSSGGVQQVATWQGRFSMTASSAQPSADPGSGPAQESALGSFVLRRTRPGDALALSLYSPLGQTVASAAVDAGGARIELADGRRFEARDADTLAEQSFGWRMPLSRLADWLDGRTDGDAVRDDQGRLLRATDSNWQVVVTDWDGRLPRRLELSWPVEPVVPPRAVRLRLVVER